MCLRVTRKKGTGTSELLEGSGMPGLGTREWDGGWSMFTLLLPTKHIPTTESWRLFNLQIINYGSFPSALYNNKGVISFYVMKHYIVKVCKRSLLLKSCEHTLEIYLFFKTDFFCFFFFVCPCIFIGLGE